MRDAAASRLGFAYRFAHRALVFSRGELIADGGVDEAFASRSVLTRAGLGKPLIRTVAELLESRFPEKGSSPAPRTVEELRRRQSL